MHITTRNVNTAFHELVRDIHHGTIPVRVSPSRYGEVLVVDEPVTLTYTHPRERVLFNPARNANPFLHLYEALWMLAGRNDVAPLAYYVKRMTEFSDNGTTFNGAYGYRWRKAWGWQDIWQQRGTDQLTILVDHLRANPWSRRAVLQMWNVEDDLLKIGGGPCSASKDVCCNLSVLFAVRPGTCPYCRGSGGVSSPHTNRFHPCAKCNGKPHEVPRYLDMTVFNRSNDLIWGMLGANAVHFSFLQEYMACALGLDMGVYNQVSNNMHVYTNNWKPEEWLQADYNQPLGFHPANPDDWDAWYNRHTHRWPLVADLTTFDAEVGEFAERHSKDAIAMTYTEPFLARVAQPMCIAYHHYKRKDYRAALASICNVQQSDWYLAGKQWLERRERRSKV